MNVRPMQAVNDGLSLVGQPQFADPGRWEEQLGESLAIIYGDRWRSALHTGAEYLATDRRAADLLHLTGFTYHPIVALYIIDVAMRTSLPQQGEQ